MTDEKMMALFRKSIAPQKFINRQWLLEHYHHQDETRIYYLPCPICGQDSHFLTEGRLSHGKAPVVTCVFAMQHLIIQEPDILGIIENEEREFRSLLERWAGKVPEKLTAEKAFRLRTQDGVPQEVLEMRVDDLQAFDQLLEDHRKKSGNVFRKEIF